jgi:hypothetical protein
MPERASVKEILRLLEIEDASILESLRREGLFQEDTVGPDAADELRVALTLVRDLGVNPAGVEVALHLRRRVLVLQQLTESSLRRLLAELETR